MKFSKNHYFILAVIIFGFVLRIWGINFGLPFLLHQDEPIVVNHAVAYGSGGLNPHFFIIPPFCSYLLFASYGIYFLSARVFGIFDGINDFALKFFTDPGSFYLIARAILGLVPGMLCVWLCYLLYKRLFQEEGSLYAAAAVAVSFLCVVNSHYAYVDNIMVVFVLAGYLSLLKMIEEPAFKNYLLSAIFLGLAAGTKYNGALLAVSFFAAHIIIVFNGGFDKKRIILDKYLWAAAFISLATFIITNPFSVLDWQFFLNTMLKKIRGGYIGWTHHISYSLYEGVGLGLLIAGLFGLIAISFKERKRALFFLSFPVVFYLHLVIRSQRFSRYALPLIPFLAIAAGFFIFRVVLPKAKGRLQKALVIILSIILLIPTAVKSVKANLLFCRKDTRVISADWIEKNIPAHTKIAVDHTSFRPQILQTKEQICNKFNIANRQKGLKEAKEKKLEFLLKAVEGKKAYNVYFLTYKDEGRGQFLSTVPSISYDIDKLVKNGIYYVVINCNTLNKEKYDFIKGLQGKARIVMEFSPYYDRKIRQRYDKVDTTFMSIGSKELFKRRITGPCLVVYKIRRR